MHMNKVLYITANPKPIEDSYGLTVGKEFLHIYEQQHPQDELIHIDLYEEDIPFIDLDILNGWDKLTSGIDFEDLKDEEKKKIGRMNAIIEQFISADKYVFVTPMWNFTFPPLMKTYIDAICVAGKTFKYTENGPVGLMTGKKALHIQASGGIYSEGPAKGMEYGHAYLKAVLGFLGIEDMDSIFIEGMAQNPDKAEAIRVRAIEEAQEKAKGF